MLDFQGLLLTLLTCISPAMRISGELGDSHPLWFNLFYKSWFEVAGSHEILYQQIIFFEVVSAILACFPQHRRCNHEVNFHYPRWQNQQLCNRLSSVQDLIFWCEGGVDARCRHCNPHVLDRWCESRCQSLAKHHLPTFHHHRSCYVDRPLPFRGQRIGEAANPGPVQLSTTFAIVNPTSMDNKEQEFKELCEKHCVDTIACSETTATIEVQKKATNRFRFLGMQSVWSPPVDPQKIRLNDAPSLRGKVGGTSMHSKLPIRLCRNPSKNPTNTRMVHTIVNLGPLTIQCIVIYGLTRSIGGSKDYTNQLVTEAYEAASCLPFPLMLMGDFNHDVHSLDIYGTLQEQGYMSLQQKYQAIYDCSMPNTCKDVTCPDTAILHPNLHPLVLAIGVDKSHLFDTHDPVILTLQIPQSQIFKKLFVSRKLGLNSHLRRMTLRQLKRKLLRNKSIQKHCNNGALT